MGRSMIIIGGGMAGLSTGCYAQMNGYDSTIFERHSLPGGLCTSWKRGDYTFDGCVHWLAGSSGDGLMGKYWNEVGALEGREFAYHEVFTRIETGTHDDMKTFTVYSDADRTNAGMKAIGPEDGCRIDAFTDMIKRFTGFPSAFDKPFELMGMRDYLEMFRSMRPYLKDFNAYRDMTIGAYAKGFRNPHLREGVAGILGDPAFSFLAVVLMLAWQHDRNAGYPIGGSLEFSRAIEKKYEELGGIFRCSSHVGKIVVERDKAVGIRLDDGTERYADIVVSAADGYATIFEMLSGKFLDQKIRKRYDSLPLFEPLFCLSLGVRRDFSGEAPLSVHILRQPIEIEKRVQTKIGIKHYCYDRTMSPTGKSVLQVLYPSDYDYWKILEEDRRAYEDEKTKIARRLVAALEEFHPGIGKDIEALDVATPLTFERYTGNRRGSFEGWFMTPRAMTMRMPKTLPGLRNFYMVGQWVQPGGGLTNSLKSGRDLVSILCAKDGRPFMTA